MLALALAASLAASAAAQAPPPLTLAQAVAQARASSPLRGSAERLAEGTATAARLAGRLLNPVVDVRGENWTPGSAAQLPLDVFAVVSQQVELGGKRPARMGLAAADRDVAGRSLSSVDRMVALRTIQLYVQALRARGLLDTLTANHEGLTTLTTTMRRRVEEGRSSESDLLRFATESARMDIDMARARLELGRSLNALTFVIGATGPITADRLIEPAPVAPPRPAPDTLAQQAAKHPDAQLAKAHWERARQSAALERARGVPDAIVSAGYKRTGGFNSLVAGVALAVPIFDRNRSAAARASGEEHAAAAEHDAVVRRLTADTAALLETAQALADRSTRAVSDLLEPAAVVRSAALAAFREGATDVLRLIDAERVYGDVRRTALELRLEALVAALEARFAIGEETIP
jgi:cobalt-zinc-cadmium efflux system outer membrane protein